MAKSHRRLNFITKSEKAPQAKKFPLEAETSQAKPKAYKPIKSYSFYEDGEKFVKVVLNVAGAGRGAAERVSATLRRRALEVTVEGLGGANYIFKVAKLHDRYLEGRVSCVVKPDKIIVKMEKENPKDHVFALYKQKMVGEAPSDDDDA